jgi:hypothetical protein
MPLITHVLSLDFNSQFEFVCEQRTVLRSHVTKQKTMKWPYENKKGNRKGKAERNRTKEHAETKRKKLQKNYKTARDLGKRLLFYVPYYPHDSTNNITT